MNFKEFHRSLRKSGGTVITVSDIQAPSRAQFSLCLMLDDKLLMQIKSTI
jgi:hypothetical protein